MKWLLNRRSRILVVTCALCLFACLGWYAVPPSYSFKLKARTTDRDDVFALVSLATDLRQIQQWSPEFVASGPISDLAAWINYSPNLEAKNARELRRDGSKDFFRINGQILLLELSDQGNLLNLRKLTKPEIEKELIRRLIRCKERRKDASFAKIATLPTNCRLLERCDCSPFPLYSNPIRAILSSVTGWRPDDRARWVVQFLHAVERDISPVAFQYASIDRSNIVPLNTLGLGRLELHKRRNSEIPETIYRGENSTSDFDLRWIAGSDKSVDSEFISSAHRAYDTGISIVRLPWVKESPSGADWRTEWPPTPSQIGCRTQRLKDFLCEFGLPLKVVVSSGSISATGKWNQTDINLLIDLSSEDFPSWQDRLTLPLSGQTSPTFRKEFVKRIMEHNQRFLAYVAAQTAFCGLPAEISRSEENERSVDVTVKHPELGRLKLRGTLGRDGRFGWDPMLAIDDRVRIVESLTRVDSSLAGLESQISLTNTSIEPSKGRIGFEFRINQDDETTPHAPIEWSLGGTKASESTVVVPESIPIVVKPHKVESGSKTATSWTRDKLGQEASRILSEEYSNLAGYLSHSAQLRAAGVEIRLGLLIADWKALELGPVIVNSIDEVRPTIDKLLGHESVIKASIVQWKECGPFHHPRYGNITAELTRWSPREPLATIRCAFRLQDLGELPWTEDTRLNGNEWTHLDKGLLADRIGKGVMSILDRLPRLLEEQTGIPAESIELKLDLTGIEGNRWLDFDPPQIALEGTGRLTMFEGYLPSVKLGGIIIDSEGLHTPKEYGFGLPTTIPLPAFAISEPSLMISLLDQSLRFGGKMTPPVPLIGAMRNPWLDFFYNDASLRGYWNRPQLDGTSSVALVRTPDVAQGTMAANFQSSSLLGELRAGGRLPGMPSVPARLGGRLEASGATKSIDLQTRAQVFDEDVAALTLEAGGARNRQNIDKRFDDPYGFGVHGKVRIPLIASVNVTGETTSGLDLYTIKGRGVAGPFSCLVTATENEVRMEKEFKTESGFTGWDEWDPNLTTLNQPDPSGVGGVGLQPGMSGRIASESDQQFAIRTFNRRPDEPESATKEPTLDFVPRERFQEITGTIFSRGSNSSLKATHDGQLVVEIPQTHLPKGNLGNEWRVFIWTATNGSGYALFVHKQDPVAGYVAFTSATSTSKLCELPNLLPIPAGSQTLLFQRYFRLSVLDSDEIQDVKIPLMVNKSNVAAFEYKLRMEPNSSVWAVFDVQGAPLSTDIHSAMTGITFSAGTIDPKRLSLLFQQRPDHALPRAILVNEELGAVGWYISEGRSAPGGTVILTRAEGDTVRRSEFSFNAPELNFVDRLQIAHCLTRAALRTPDIAKGRAWFGSTGVIVEDEKILWIIRNRSANEPQVDRLPRASFDKWASETKNFLPKDWRTEEQRTALDVKTIAATALSDGFSKADRLDEPVNRLGLLQTLARELGLPQQ